MANILVIDIGNTSTSIGYYNRGTVSHLQRCKSHFQCLEEVLELVSIHPAEQVVIASVVPSINTKWEEVMLRAKLPSPLFISHKIELGVAVDYPIPENIGADRLANAAAAKKLFGTPAVVCDFGTALTFDVIDNNRGYIGGIICPGLPLMFDYLAEKTAQLPHVKPSATREIVGRSTQQAMQIGARIGYRGMVREILQSLEKEFAAEKLNICCTGGYAEWIFDDWDVPATIDPLLTLKGLGMIGELNQ